MTSSYNHQIIIIIFTCVVQILVGLEVNSKSLVEPHQPLHLNSLQTLQPPVLEVAEDAAQGDADLVTEPGSLIRCDGVEAGAEVGARLGSTLQCTGHYITVQVHTYGYHSSVEVYRIGHHSTVKVYRTGYYNTLPEYRTGFYSTVQVYKTGYHITERVYTFYLTWAMTWWKSPAESGDMRWYSVLLLPALCPASVTRPGSPPNLNRK